MKSLRLGFSSRISPDFWILSGIEGTPEVRGGGDGGRSRPGAVQEAARYLREPTVGACLLIGTGKEEKSDYRENWAIGGGGGGSGAGSGHNGAKGGTGAGWFWGTAVPKGGGVGRSGTGWVWGTGVPKGCR